MLYDKDAGHTQYLEDIYEAQSRMPGGSWGQASVPWSDVVSRTVLIPAKRIFITSWYPARIASKKR